MKIMGMTSDVVTGIVSKVTEMMGEFIDVIKSEENSKEKFAKVSDGLADIMNHDCSVFQILQTITQSFSLIPLKASLLPELNGSLLKMIEAFNTFNHELNIKRKRDVSA